MGDPLNSCTADELAWDPRAGSLDAIEELVARYEGRIFRLCITLTRSPEDAREITQDSFVRAFQSIGQFRTGRSFAAWIFTIARNRCIDHHRSSPPPSEPLDAETPVDGNPSEDLERREGISNLWNLARKHLSPDQFQVLYLKYVEGMDFREIAQILGRTQTHTKVIAFRARCTMALKLSNAPDFETSGGAERNSLNPAKMVPTQAAR